MPTACAPIVGRDCSSVRIAILEPLALLAEAVLDRHLAIGEMQRHGRRAVDAELLLGLAHGEPLHAGLDQERGDALGALGARGRHEHRDDSCVRAVGHPHLRAVDDVAVALPDGRAEHRGRVRARSRFRERERRGHLAAGEARQEPALLLLVPAEDEGITAEVLHQEDRGRRGARPRHLLGGEAERERSRGGAAVLLGDVQSHQPLLAEHLELLGRVLPRLVDVRREGRDTLARNLAREVAHGALLVGQVVELAQRISSSSDSSSWRSRRSPCRTCGRGARPSPCASGAGVEHNGTRGTPRTSPRPRTWWCRGRPGRGV